MPLVVLLLLLGGAALEIWVAIRMTDLVGVLPVVLLLIGSALLGARVLRRRAVRVLGRLGDPARASAHPGHGVLDGALILLAAALLLLPGLVSGALGLLLLAPPVRAVLRPLVGALLLRRLGPLLAGARLAGGFRGPGGPAGPGRPGDVEGHATERAPGPGGPPADGRVRGVVLPPSDPRGPGRG